MPDTNTLLIIVWVMTIVSLLGLVMMIFKCFKTRRELNSLTLKLKDYDDEHNLITDAINTKFLFNNIGERVEDQNKLLELIDYIIEIEVVNQFRYKLLLEEKIDILNADVDLQTIATRTYNSIKPEIFLNENNILTEEYLLDYINKKTFLTYVQTYKNNSSVGV